MICRPLGHHQLSRVTRDGHVGVQKSQLSWLCENIDEKVKAVLGRPLKGDRPQLWTDRGRPPGPARRADRIRRRDHRHRRKYERTARGPGREIGASEAEPIRTELLRKLTSRGLRGVKRPLS